MTREEFLLTSEKKSWDPNPEGKLVQLDKLILNPKVQTGTFVITGYNSRQCTLVSLDPYVRCIQADYFGKVVGIMSELTDRYNDMIRRIEKDDALSDTAKKKLVQELTEEYQRIRITPVIPKDIKRLQTLHPVYGDILKEIAEEKVLRDRMISVKLTGNAVTKFIASQLPKNQNF